MTYRHCRHGVRVLAVLLLANIPRVAVGGPAAQVENDWLLQEQYRHETRREAITTQADAAGACDGVKNGKWGFHTGLTESPWWQVDLGERRAIARVVIWNRCDGASERASRLMLRVSEDGEAWQRVYAHDGATFYGQSDGKPLTVALSGEEARFVRIQLPGTSFFHLDEVEIFGPDSPERNLAFQRPADQDSTSQWSTYCLPPRPINWFKRVADSLAYCKRLARDWADAGIDVSREVEAIARFEARMKEVFPTRIDREHYLGVRRIQRRLMLATPLVDFDALLVTKRVPGSFNHMSDQYYGWWSRPGGGIYVLRGFREDAPTLTCITDAFSEAGSFLRPMLSYDAGRVLFAWCRHYPHLAAEQNKLDKAKVPEDAFYHLFEMNLDGSEVRQLTHGKYDDFDGRYLPDGRMVFLSTRRGQAVQCGLDSAQRTRQHADLPDAYVRCGGGPERPVAVYTLHTMEADGGGLCAISPFEMFEWTPSVARDGAILYSRWDYIDRDNMPYMSLWAINPDGTNARLVYGNFTKAPHCAFEPRSIPDSNKIILTASGHHAQTMGSLVLLDPAAGTEGDAPVTRITPETPFPEIEAWPQAYFANPWPLSERFHLVAWGIEEIATQGNQRSPSGMGIYLLDSAGGMELLYRDPDISCAYPIPVRPQPRPPVLASTTDRVGPAEGCFLLTDVYRRLGKTGGGAVNALRIVAIPAKTHPTMNFPSLGVTHDDPGKCVLGTVPVENDGSAHFRVPAGVIVFFQALDKDGMAIQTMRSATHVQPGQTLSCIGCHESRQQAPPQKRVLAAGRPPSKITVGPEGSWPLRFDRLVQPVLDKHCARCHRPDSSVDKAKDFDLSAAAAYASLINYGKPSLAEHVQDAYRRGYSMEGRCAARNSALLAKLTGPEAHHDVQLSPDAVERLITWMDTYAQRLGSFCDAQEQELLELRQRHADLLIERPENPATLVSLAANAGILEQEREEDL